MLVLGIPLAASAGGKDTKPKPDPKQQTFVAPGMLSKAAKHPDTTIHVIVTANDGNLPKSKILDKALGHLGRGLSLIDGISLDLKAKDLAELSQIPGLTITPDAPVQLAGVAFSSTQLWVPSMGINDLWGDDNNASNPAKKAPTIAVVDSGIDTSKTADFGARVIKQVNLCSLTGNSAGDGRGHGTFVAGIAAGSGPGYGGASPYSKLVSVDVMDDTGTARTSDVIAGAQWILANKDAYNIRVANFSLHSSSSSSFTRDPLDKAVEKLWFAGVTVVAAAGNYGSPTGPSGVKYAPGNDPFVITVGATDLAGDPGPANDTAAPWSAYGYTNDGFAKPEVAADGRYILGPIPMNSTLAAQKATNIVAPGYIQLSGTSFAAPIVAGTAAQILARHPTWTPDQVKGALMVTARPTPAAKPGSTGVGEVNSVKSTQVTAPPNPNQALDQFLVQDPSGGSVPVFDATRWANTAKANVSWDAVSWANVSWSDVSWADVSWSDVSWADVSWSDVSWADVSWSDVSYEDAAEGDSAADPSAYLADASDLAAVAADPALRPNDPTLPATTTPTTTPKESTVTAGP
jgi:serine protease AprX